MQVEVENVLMRIFASLLRGKTWVFCFMKMNPINLRQNKADGA